MLRHLGRHLYSRKETLALYNAWLTVGSIQRLAHRLVQSHRRKSTKPQMFLGEGHRRLRRVKADGGSSPQHEDAPQSLGPVRQRCQKFCSIYRAEAEQYQSGASDVDILRAAMRVFKDDVQKDFKHIDGWELVRNKERWVGVSGPRAGNARSTRGWLLI